MSPSDGEVESSDTGPGAASGPTAAGRAQPAGGTAGFDAARAKYAVEGLVGSGGMGDVYLVTDRDLRRRVAMKVLRAAAGSDDEARLSFVAEAQATSQLEHPGVPPVHDLGVGADGRVWFTMKLVRGRTLAEVVRDLFLGRPDVHREWSMHRLVGVVERLCDTLEFAHRRGVVHRDVKPSNVMLGDFGEVHLMDWGVAWVDGEARPAADAPDPAVLDRIATARTDAGARTEAGAVKGTLAYMAPEQLAGAVGPATDVFALGCVLYEVLALQPAFDGEGAELVRRVLAAAPPPVEARNPRRPVPPALAEIVARAMAKDPAARYTSAREVGAALRTWLDGTGERARRHREAEALARRGRDAIAAWEARRTALAAAEVAAADEAARVKPWQPIAEKRAFVAARRRVADLEREVAFGFADAVRLLDAALVEEEGNATARAALAGLWRHRLDEAEARRDAAGAAYAATMLRRHDDGTHAAHLDGHGTLTLRSEPEGAEVTLAPFVERDGVLVAGDARPLGRTPLAPVPLAQGSYLCVLSKPGFRDVRYPVHVGRNGAWDGTVRLRTERELGPDAVLVPGGPCVVGEGRGARVVEVADFVIERLPVTFGAWLEFLAAVERDEGLEAATARVPRISSVDAPYVERSPAGVWTVRTDLVTGPVAERLEATHGPGWRLRLPVMAVSFDDASAFARWRARVTGRPWRLPTEDEREKAARGVDGRAFPWGDLEDATLGRCRESRPEAPQPEPVGSFPAATSVYGMGDAAGNVWDWVDGWFDAHRSARVLKGGAWNTPAATLRCSARYALAPGFRYPNAGLRLARTP